MRHAEALEALARDAHGRERLVVKGELALQVVLRVVARQRLGGGHDERLEPRGVAFFGVGAAGELLELEQERRLVRGGGRREAGRGGGGLL